MGRDITTINQTNLWGKQSDDGGGLEPQRSDLFIVDFDAARNNVAKVANRRLAEIMPHYVKSITLPELRTKADPVRRDSVSYNMPSWDDPLDPIKLNFMIDTHDDFNRIDVISFLDTWLALSRAGRGARYQGYTNTRNCITLNADYRVDFMFDVNVYLLRGGTVNFNATGNSPDSIQAQTVRANEAIRAKKKAGLTQQGASSINTDNAGLFSAPTRLDTVTVSASRLPRLGDDMVIHATYILRKAWLAGYKLTDLSYTSNELLGVEATFYADAADLDAQLDMAAQAERLHE